MQAISLRRQESRRWRGFDVANLAVSPRQLYRFALEQLALNLPKLFQLINNLFGKGFR